MHTNPRFWSDGFQIVHDTDITDFFKDDLEDIPSLAERVSDARLRADPGELNFWDE